MQVLRYNPSAFWRLDDAAPFEDYSGNSRLATLSGTAQRGLSLAADSTYSQFFDASHVGTFDCPVYKQGREADAFSLAATVYPTVKTENLTERPYQENLAYNPLAVSTGPSYEYGSRYGWVLSWRTDGTNIPTGRNSYARFTAPAAQTGVSGRGVDLYGNYDVSPPGNSAPWKMQPVTPGETVTVSAWVRWSVDVNPSLAIRFYHETGFPFEDTNTSFGMTTAGTWKRVHHTVVVPEGVKWLAARVLPVGSVDYPAGATMDITGVQVEKGPLTSYIDGDQPGIEWMGTPNASGSRSIRGISVINYHPNPNVENGTTYWQAWAGTGGVASTARMTDGGKFGNSYYRITWTTASTNGGDSGTAEVPIYHPGMPYSASIWIRSNTERPVAPRLAFGTASGDTTITTGPSVTLPVNTWVQFKMENIVSPADAIVARIYVGSGGATSVRALGEIQDADGAVIVQGTTVPDFFDGGSSDALWGGTPHASSSYLLASDGEQKILSKVGRYDGLTIDGTKVRFSTEYADGSKATCEYDIDIPRKIDVVGVHTETKNSLFIDGVLVDEVDISETQQTLSYYSSGTVLESGPAMSSRGIYANNFALFPKALTTDQIQEMYLANNRVSVGDIPKMYGGESIGLSSIFRPSYLFTVWNEDEHWNRGDRYQVESEDGILFCSTSNGLTMGGEWAGAVNLYNGEAASAVQSLNLDWEGMNVTVQASLDMTTWETVVRGKKVALVTPGFNPTDKDLFIKVTFPSGQEEAYIQNLRIKAYLNADNVVANRTINYDSQTVPMDEFEAHLLREDWGVRLNGGTLTVNPVDSVSDTPQITKTIEVWMKRLPGSISYAGLDAANVFYVNGVLTSTTPVGEWVVSHFVKNDGFASNIQITGDVIVGKVALYPDALTQSDVTNIVTSYTGVKVLSTASSGLVGVGESVSPLQIYSHDWGIETT